jgi:hypothetical protein
MDTKLNSYVDGIQSTSLDALRMKMYYSYNFI